jgi:hypothetical protein
MGSGLAENTFTKSKGMKVAGGAVREGSGSTTCQMSQWRPLRNWAGLRRFGLLWEMMTEIPASKPRSSQQEGRHIFTDTK